MIKKAILPVAGFGTLFLSVNKTILKKILPIVQGDLTQLKTLDASTAGLIQTIIKE